MFGGLVRIHDHSQTSATSSWLVMQVERLIRQKAALLWYEKQYSHQNLQAKGHKYCLMTTPIILNVVIVSTKHLLHVYHCHQSILAQFNVS